MSRSLCFLSIRRCHSTLTGQAAIKNVYSRLNQHQIIVVDNYACLVQALQSITDSKLIGLSSRPQCTQVSSSDKVFIFPKDSSDPVFSEKMSASVAAVLQSEAIEKVTYKYIPLNCTHNKIVESAKVDQFNDEEVNSPVGDMSTTQLYSAAADAYAALQAYRRKVDGVDEEYNPEKLIVTESEVPEPKRDLPPYPGLRVSDIVKVETEEQLLEARASLTACKAIGFDSEWDPHGHLSSRPDLIQLSTPTRAYLFSTRQRAELTFQRRVIGLLKSILEKRSIVKVGFGLQQDLKQLQFRLNCVPINMVDMGQTLRHLVPRRITVGLSRAIGEVLQQSYVKNRRIAMSKWSVPLNQLTDAQMLYAANDAHAALLVYQTWHRQQKTEEENKFKKTDEESEKEAEKEEEEKVQREQRDSDEV